MDDEFERAIRKTPFTETLTTCTSVKRRCRVEIPSVDEFDAVSEGAFQLPGGSHLTLLAAASENANNDEAADMCPLCTIAEASMDYKPEHASRALRIIEELMPHVSSHPLYAELAEVLRDRTRWHEAHDLFSSIRTAITLPNERRERRWWRRFVHSSQSDIDSLFAYVAENAAKTAYNCSGRPAPFDDDSFEWLLKCEEKFNATLNES